MSAPSVSAIFVRPLVLALGFLGLQPADVLASHGLTAADLEDPDARFDAEIAIRLWETVAATSGHPHVGMRTAELIDSTVPFGALQILDYATAACSNLEQAIRRHCSYSRLLADPFLQLYLEVSDTEAVLSSRIEGLPLHRLRHATECFVATLLLRMRKHTRTELVPLAVRFRHPAPSDTAPHRQLFGRMPEFGARADEVVLAPAALQLPLPGADPALCTMLDRYAQELLARVPADENAKRPPGKVREALLEALKGGDARMGPVARRLGMSPRTLQRRLADEGTTFEGLLDEIRHELAVGYLGDAGLAASEVAFALGFSDPAAFHRAFKRWTGEAPGAWRKRRVAALAG